MPLNTAIIANAAEENDRMLESEQLEHAQARLEKLHHLVYSLFHYQALGDKPKVTLVLGELREQLPRRYRRELERRLAQNGVSV